MTTWYKAGVDAHAKHQWLELACKGMKYSMPDQCITRSNGTRVCAVCDAMERHGYDTRSKLADTRVKLAEIKKLWFEIENEFPDGIVFEVKDRTKLVNACAQLRYLLGDI